MKNNIFACFIIIWSFYGCHRTEYGERRYNANRFKLFGSNSTPTYIIDTLAFYESIMYKDKYGSTEILNNGSGLKFYKNGKVGFFKNVDLERSYSLNPERARMGFCGFNENEFIIEYFFEIPSGIGLASKRGVSIIDLQKSNLDTLYITSVKTSTSAGGTTIYLRVRLADSIADFVPDW